MKDDDDLSPKSPSQKEHTATTVDRGRLTWLRWAMLGYVADYLSFVCIIVRNLVLFRTQAHRSMS